MSHAGNDLPIEQTYTEWRQGPYNTTDPQNNRTLSGLPHEAAPRFSPALAAQRPDNPGYASPEIMGGKKRPHIWTHYFVGGSVTPISLPPNSSSTTIGRLRD